MGGERMKKEKEEGREDLKGWLKGVHCSKSFKNGFFYHFFFLVIISPRKK